MMNNLRKWKIISNENKIDHWENSEKFCIQKSLVGMSNELSAIYLGLRISQKINLCTS